MASILGDHWDRSHWSGGDVRRERMTRRYETTGSKQCKRARSPQKSAAARREADSHFAAKRREAKRELHAKNTGSPRARSCPSTHAPAWLPKDDAKGRVS